MFSIDNDKNQPIHFETGKFKGNSDFVPDKEYSKALDCLVKGCSDILITRKTKDDASSELDIYIGKRCVEPQKDWWYPAGGRLRPGETPFLAGKRIIERELGIQIEENRFSLVGYYSYLWELRKQEPIQNGTADISCVLCLVLTDEEITKIKPNRTEYEDHKWLNSSVILDDKSCFHPALKRSVRDLLKRNEFNALKNFAKFSNDLEDIGKKFKTFIQGLDN